MRVPRVGLGASGFNLGSRSESERIVHAAGELGLNFIDTADVYNDGESEMVIGQAVKGRRDQFIIATKCGHHSASRGASRRAIRIAVHESLRRLGTDHLDIVHLHAPDPVTPCEETIASFQDLVREGKVLYYGLSNHAAWQIVDAVHMARALNGAPPLSTQLQINATKLGGHADLLPALERVKVGILAASPLARGLLGRPYSVENPPAEGHPLCGRKGHLTWTERNLAVAARLREIAGANNCAPAQLALGLVLALPLVASVLVRPTAVSDLDDYLAAPARKPSPSELIYILHGRADTAA